MTDLGILKNQEQHGGDIKAVVDENEKSLLSVVIKNVAGSLAKVTGYCAQNNMNIERLVLSNFKTDGMEQKVILYITGDRNRINSLVDGLKQIDVVVEASNFQANNYIERELILVKVKNNNPQMQRIMDLVSEYDGNTVLFRNNLVIFQFINSEDKNSELMERLEHITSDIDIIKSGIVATSLDSKTVEQFDK